MGSEAGVRIKWTIRSETGVRRVGLGWMVVWNRESDFDRTMGPRPRAGGIGAGRATEAGGRLRWMIWSEARVGEVGIRQRMGRKPESEVEGPRWEAGAVDSEVGVGDWEVGEVRIRPKRYGRDGNAREGNVFGPGVGGTDRDVGVGGTHGQRVTHPDAGIGRGIDGVVIACGMTKNGPHNQSHETSWEYWIE